jgi:hypothetical protein
MEAKVVVFLCSLSLLNLTTLGQSPTHDSVKTAVNQLFDGMRRADSLQVVSAFWPSATLQTIAGSANTPTVVINQTVEGFGRSVATRSPGELDEQITFASVNIDGDLASVWTPYRFYLKGNFNHAGANSFQLVRIQGVWKIQYLIDTRRK